MHGHRPSEKNRVLSYHLVGACRTGAGAKRRECGRWHSPYTPNLSRAPALSHMVTYKHDNYTRVPAADIKAQLEQVMWQLEGCKGSKLKRGNYPLSCVCVWGVRGSEGGVQ